MDFFNMNRGFQQPQLPAFNPQQFAQVAMTLDRNSLEKLVALARQRGISDSDISAGLNYINSLR
jgi:hypothetical protein